MASCLLLLLSGPLQGRGIGGEEGDGTPATEKEEEHAHKEANPLSGSTVPCRWGAEG